MVRHAMRDVVVLIPGIMGSVLRRQGRVVWGFSASKWGRALFTRGGSIRRDLALPSDDVTVDDLDDGIVADALMPDLHLLPGFWKIDGYSKIYKTLQMHFDLVPGENFFTFPYDWRRHSAVAARKLARNAHAWLATWRSKSGSSDPRLVLVAHSLGGLVSRYFLECLDGWKLTRALITFGTPYRGSLNALDSLVNGLKKGPFELTELVRELTSVYELLPTYKCCDGGDGKLARIAETSSIPHVDLSKAVSALAFHRTIEAAVVANRKLEAYRTQGYAIHPVVGIAQETHQSAVLENGRVALLPTHNGQTLGGDGTVSRVSAIPLELSTEAPGAVYVGTRHGSLQNAQAVLTHLGGVLSGFDVHLGGFRRAKGPIALRVDDLFLADEPIVIGARGHTAEGAQLKAALWRAGDEFCSQEIVLTGDSRAGEWQSGTFAPLEEGAYRVVVSGDGLEPAEDAFAVTTVTGGAA